MPDYAPLIERAFALDLTERSYRLEPSAAIPSYVAGTCYLNGPARFGRAGLAYRNWLDGDGMVCALAFDGDGIRFTNRFVRSEKWVAEEAAGRPLFRTFGTAFDGDRLKRGIGLVSPVNVSIYPYGDAMLAFGEQGLPWALDPVTLETRGAFTFGGQINELTPFAAHPKFDPDTGEMFNFGVSFSAQHPVLNVFRFDAEGRQVYRRRLPLPYPASIHDFALGPRHAAFYVSPFVLDIAALMREGRTLMDALSWEPTRGSVLLVVDRESGDLAASIPIGERYCLHLINAFDQEGRLVVDVLESERPLYGEYQVLPDLFTDVGRGQPVRFVVDVAGGVVERRGLDYWNAPDFAAIDARLSAQPYDRFWMLGIGATGQPGRKFFDQLVACDWMSAGPPVVYQAQPGEYFAGEPLVITAEANPSETPGVVVVAVFEAARPATRFDVFDSRDIRSGPIASLPLAAPIPPLFHAGFRPRGSR